MINYVLVAIYNLLHYGHVFNYVVAIKCKLINVVYTYVIGLLCTFGEIKPS